MSSAQVGLVRCADYDRTRISGAIERQFNFFGGIERFVKRSDRVLLKPNFIAPKKRKYACQTDPAVIIETARLLKDFGARPFVGDSPAWGDVFGSAQALGLFEPLERLGVPIKSLKKPRRCRIGPKGIKVGISGLALEADVIINLPKFKTHQQLVTTFAVKNMFGCVTGKKKALWHFLRGGRADDFCELLIEIYKYLNPAFTIIDAVEVMDGPGPINGRARPLGYVVAGADPVACEVVCCKLVSLEPQLLPMIKAAGKLGFGCCDAEKIEVLGDGIDDVCSDFELPELIPVRFSLLHVCKSICKQILILTRRFLKRL